MPVSTWGPANALSGCTYRTHLQNGQHPHTDRSLYWVRKQSVQSEARWLAQGGAVEGAARYNGGRAEQQGCLQQAHSWCLLTQHLQRQLDHQQRDAEFRRSLWGFPPPFSILPLNGEPTCSLVFFEECLPFLHIPQFPLSTLDLRRAPMLCLHTFMEAAIKA